MQKLIIEKWWRTKFKNAQPFKISEIRNLIYFFKDFLLGFLNFFIVQYNYKNWVWLGLELGASLTLQWVSWPPLVTGD